MCTEERPCEDSKKATMWAKVRGLTTNQPAGTLICVGARPGQTQLRGSHLGLPSAWELLPHLHCLHSHLLQANPQKTPAQWDVCCSQPLTTTCYPLLPASLVPLLLIYLFSPLRNPMKYGLLLPPFYRWRNWGRDGFIILPSPMIF